MKKKTRKKDSHDNGQAIVLVGNTYRRNVNPLPVIAVKLMLTYMLAVGTIMSFMDMYDIPFEFGYCAGSAVRYGFYAGFHIYKKALCDPCSCSRSRRDILFFSQRDK